MLFVVFSTSMVAEVEIDTGRHLLWSTACILVLLLAFALVMLYRRWLNAPSNSTGGFTLSDLRKLHREGKISAEEYEKAKIALIGAFKTSEPQTPPPDGPRKQNADQDGPNPQN